MSPASHPDNAPVELHCIAVGDSPSDIAAGRSMLGIPRGPKYVKTVEFITRPTLRMLHTQLVRLMGDMEFLCTHEGSIGVGYYSLGEAHGPCVNQVHPHMQNYMRQLCKVSY